MTSGNFRTFPVDKIWVNRAKRQRRELTGIEDLAESIGRVGLIQPPVIRKDGELIVGERRWSAVKLLGWTDISVQFIEDLPEDELRRVELEENVRRVDIPWQENCLAVEEYHSIRLREDAAWTAAQTAEALGMSPQDVSKKRAIAQEITAGNTKVAAAPKLSTADGIVRREVSRKLASIIPVTKQVEVPIINEDFHEWAKIYDGPAFNLIHCDFPYGVNADKHAQGAAKSHSGYADTPDIYYSLIAELHRAMVSIISDSAHLMFWFSMDYYANTKLLLEEMGWRVDPFPLIWYKSDNTGILPDPSRGPRRIYETAFFASRGDRKIVRSKSNVCAHPVVKIVHMSEKPVAMLQHFLEMFCDEYSAVLDPTCGSGNALRAARNLKANLTLGLERDPNIFAAATAGWQQAESGDEGGGGG